VPASSERVFAGSGPVLPALRPASFRSFSYGSGPCGFSVVPSPSPLHRSARRFFSRLTNQLEDATRAAWQWPIPCKNGQSADLEASSSGVSTPLKSAPTPARRGARRPCRPDDRGGRPPQAAGTTGFWWPRLHGRPWWEAGGGAAAVTDGPCCGSRGSRGRGGLKGGGGGGRAFPAVGSVRKVRLPPPKPLSARDCAGGGSCAPRTACAIIAKPAPATTH